MAEPTCPFCKTPLDEHPANRCLDAWAYVVSRALAVTGDAPLEYDAPNRGVLIGHRWHVVLLFSTDIAAAFTLVEADEFLLHQRQAAHQGEERCRACVAREGDPSPLSIQGGTTSAHAITKAITAAKQEKNDA